VPLILLLFFLVQTTGMALPVAGFLALLLYSLSHVGETLRSFLSGYPLKLREQARLMGIGWLHECAGLRLPWALRHSLDALGTHWISLLKDTGALAVVGIGELTAVARVLSDRADFSDWQLILATAAALYLGSTVGLIWLLELLKKGFPTRSGLLT
jgi:ABC-type amino acid transport system permease subunit